MLGDLESVRAEAILQCVHARQEEIRQALVDRTNRIGSTQVDDFNWQLKVNNNTCTSTLTIGIIKCYLGINLILIQLSLILRPVLC